MFEAASDNEKIKHIYGNYGLWSWLRYWYLDSANMVMLQLFDKGYYDYDFEKVKKEVRWDDTVRSDEEIKDIMAGFGIGVAKKKTEMDTEQLQSFIIKEEHYG